MSAEVLQPYRLLQPAESPPGWQQGTPPRHAVPQQQLRESEHWAAGLHCSLCARRLCSTNKTLASNHVEKKRRKKKKTRAGPLPAPRLCASCHLLMCN